nr:glycosyltransferase [Arthrobacter sp. UNC362MFTsu5.1]
MLKYLLEVRRQVALERPDVVHLHSSFAGLSRLLIPRAFPIAYSPHCYAFERKDKNVAWRATLWMAEWVLARRRQVLVAVSPHEARLGKSLNSKMDVHYVPNVVTESDLTTDKTILPSVTMVGRIGNQKDPRLFAAVARECRGEIDFHWVGDGDTDLRNELLSSGVRVSGWVEPRQARRLVSESHLYLHTGSWEAAPISAAEAAANSVPVIARAIPTMESLGYFTVNGSVADLSQSVKQYFSDHQFRQQVAAQTLELANTLAPSSAYAPLSSAYVAAVGPSSPQPLSPKKSTE